ncbi:response regulator [Oscillatoria sp. FACHB-1406]|uniref:response regulator n=1 Tax=Oscillatoria sp. FACHB-1406 TaxID=2692846 RepID=UPI0016860E15|nr:response regulator [Oscillatoria sp. FACHB-1406]MBD2578207.1 response regulator [Oscillatoria sp. FACHB-1406]
MKILVVEDDELTAEALVATLSDRNYTVEVATDGESAWELIQSFSYDLLLLDVSLPQLDGLSLCKRLRSRGYRMPILLLTVRNTSHDKAMGLDAGADDYIVKPFDPEELSARIRALLRRNPTTTPAVLEWGELRLDPESCNVTYGTQPLSLTAKEYALLELFLRHNRRVFSCDAILENLWSFDEVPSEQAVRTHLKGLRHKLKAVGAPTDAIETVYGIGYRLKPLEEAKEGLASRQQTQSAIAEVWQRFQPRISEQIGVLERAIAALKRGNASPELRRAAEREAHTLAGSLGTFGFDRASQLAHSLQRHLQAADFIAVPKVEEVDRLQQLASRLRREVSGSQKQAAIPLLLIVDRDRAAAEALAAEAVNWGLRADIATSLAIARQAIEREQPDLILLDLAVSARLDNSLHFLSELQQQKPAIPVLTLSSGSDLQQRLQVLRCGGRLYLQKPMSCPQVLQQVSRILNRTDPIEAKVLVVDDDTELLQTIATLLQPWGLQITTLSDPQQFWQTLDATAPDLLVLDLKMPGVSGLELCQAVRHDARWYDLAIVILTACADTQTANQVLAAGADDFIAKPIAGPELVSRIVHRLERLKNQNNLATLQQREAMECLRSEIALRQTNNELERQVTEQTEELVRAIALLRGELEERRQVEKALRQTRMHLAEIIDIADDAIITVDRRHRITLFNRGAEKIFGYTAEDAIAQPLNMLLPPRFQQAHQQHMVDFERSTCPARRMGERQAIWGCRKNGEEFLAEASISKVQMKEETLFTVILREVRSL